jgi:hypothetical protein
VGGFAVAAAGNSLNEQVFEERQMMQISKVLALLAVAGASSAALAQAGSGGTATNGNSSFTLGDYLGDDTGTGALSNFRVGGPGNPNHAFQTWWWYRVEGDTRERSFNNAVASDWSSPGKGRLEYQTADFYAVMSFQVTGIADGYGVLTQTLTILNTSNSTKTFNLFNYNDVDLGGTAAGDSATLNGPNVIRITDASTPWVAFYEGTDAYGVDSFANLRADLSDNNVTNFNSNGLPFGPGDFTGGFQWTFTLGAGGAATASSTLTITNVPTPGAMALAGLSGLAAFRRKR